jgi:hypothetical protein
MQWAGSLDEHLVLPVIRGVHLGQKLVLGAARGKEPVFVDLTTRCAGGGLAELLARWAPLNTQTTAI